MRQLRHGAVEVGVYPTLVCDAMQDVSSVMVQNTSGTPVFVGANDVAVDGERRGIMIKPGETQSISSYVNDSSPIYAVIADSSNEGEDDESPTAIVVFLTSH